jgi:hypothetical protein
VGLAHKVIQQVNANYVANVLALAVIYGFVISPHIDNQNMGPFYRLAVGNFDDGNGGICVELSPFMMAHVNTKNELAKRWREDLHWVAPSNSKQDQWATKTSVC